MDGARAHDETSPPGVARTRPPIVRWFVCVQSRREPRGGRALAAWPWSLAACCSYGGGSFPAPSGNGSPSGSGSPSGPQLSAEPDRQHLLGDVGPQAPGRQGQGKHRGDLAEDRNGHAFRRVRCALPERIFPEGRAQRPPSTPCERGRRQPPVQCRADGHHQGRQRADRGRTLLRSRRPHRVIRQGPRRPGHRLRLADPRRYPQLLRRLRQLEGRRAARPGPGQLRVRLGGQASAGHRHEGSTHRLQLGAVRAGLQRGPDQAVLQRLEGRQQPARHLGPAHRAESSSSSSTPRTTTSTPR